MGWLLLALIALVLIIALGPRDKVALFWNPRVARLYPDKPFDEIGSADLKQLRARIAEHEAAHPEVVDGAEKTIVFSSESRPRRTKYCVMYVHGFSACRQEVAPVPENLAKALHANYFATRLTGHGIDGDALLAAKPSDWLFDIMEAWQTARQLGEQIIIISTSTGGTLTTWLAQQPDVKDTLAALVMISPNYEPYHWAAPMFVWPWSRKWLRYFSGDTYSWEPTSEAGEKYWTYSYPMAAIHGMTALARTVFRSKVERIKTPTLFMYSDDDKVVKSRLTDQIFRRWGSRVKHRISVPAKEDDNNHVVTGDIVRPDTTEQFSADILNFVKRYVD